MPYRVPPPPLDSGWGTHGEWGYLIDVEGGWQGRPATESEWLASASAPDGRGQFWGPFGRLVYVDTPATPVPAREAAIRAVAQPGGLSDRARDSHPAKPLAGLGNAINLTTG